MADVFISYSHKDGSYAHRLADELRSRQIEVWIDDRIDYGDQWPRVIQENLAACRIFIVIMSPRSFNSMWVQNEVSYAQSNRKTIFPLLLEGEVWLSIAAMQYVDVRQGDLPPEKFFERLRVELNKPLPPVPERPVTRTQISRWSKSRPWVYMFGSFLLLTALSRVLFPGLWGLLPTTPTEPVAEITDAPTELAFTAAATTDVTEPSPPDESVTQPPSEVPTSTPLYNSGVITFITRNETGEALYILEKDGHQRPLIEEPGIQGLNVLSISPPSNDPSAPRYLVASYLTDQGLNVVVINIKDDSALTISQGADRVDATYLDDGSLLVEVQDDNTATYSLYQIDGKDPVMIYTIPLSLPTSVATTTPEIVP